MLTPRRVLFALSLPVILSLGSVRADTTVTLNAIDSGWYLPGGQHDAANDNYIAGVVGGSGELRNFFVFDLSSVRGQIKGASLHVINPSLGYDSVDPFEVYTAFDVSTPVADLMA
ncbi:MAG: hypothetical protein ABJB97_04680, partial [Acidobacteriota bacterium]